MKIIGKIIYLVSYPVILLIIRNSKRVYGAIIYQNQILVTKNWLGFQNTWRLPGGGLKKNESELVGLIREANEEVGINIPKEQWSLVLSNQKHKKNFLYSVYICRLNSLPKLRIDQKEILEAKFIEIDSLTADSNVSEPLEITVTRLMTD